MKVVLWVPGRFSLTNKMLSNCRAAGSYYARRPWPKRWRDYFAEETAAIRLAVRVAARGVRMSGMGKLVLFLTVLEHWKHDPDAWLLLGKAAVDGLVDAGVIRSDRTDLYSIGGRVTASLDEDVLKWREVYGSANSNSFEPGFFIELREVERGVCGHA